MAARLSAKGVEGISVSVKKEYSAIKRIVLDNYPVVSQVVDPVLNCELLPAGTLLVFGVYKLLCCCAKRKLRISFF